MDIAQIFEIVGYVASILVAVSLLMRSILRLRIINLIGAMTFVIYGLLIKAYPVVATNSAIVLIDIYYLIGMLREKKEKFELMPSFCGDEYFNSFMKLYENDIKLFNPSFEIPAMDDVKVTFVLRDLIPAGLVISHPVKNGHHIDLDFAIPQYRDLRIGEYVFSNKEVFEKKEGPVTVFAKGEEKKHIQYLKKTGFELVDGDLYKIVIE